MLVGVLVLFAIVALAHGKEGLSCLGGIVRIVFGLTLLLIAASMV